MSGRSPARLLAPIALVVFAIAFLAVLTSGGGGGGEREEEAVRPAATAQPSKKSRSGGSSSRTRSRTYTVKPGDTPSSIAESTGVPLERLLELNPEIDPNTLRPGDKLKLPR